MLYNFYQKLFCSVKKKSEEVMPNWSNVKSPHCLLAILSRVCEGGGKRRVASINKTKKRFLDMVSSLK